VPASIGGGSDENRWQTAESANDGAYQLVGSSAAPVAVWTVIGHPLMAADRALVDDRMDRVVRADDAITAAGYRGDSGK
jgi:hypothetical protein